MGADALQSRAFERASLKSESYRVIILLVVLAVLTIFVVARGIVTSSYVLLFAQLGVLALVIAHESVMNRK